MNEIRSNAVTNTGNIYIYILIYKIFYHYMDNN